MYARRAVWLGATLSLLVGGCQSDPWQPLGFWPPAASETAGTEDRPVATAAATSPRMPESSPPDKPFSALSVAGLSDDRWVMHVRPMIPGQQEPPWRWHHLALDATFGLSPSRRPELAPCLTNPNPVVAANAAILLGRWGGEGQVDALVATAQNVQLKLPLRQAAIETLGSLSSTDATNAVAALLGSSDARSTEEIALTEIPELHAELLAARARHIAPQLDPRFADAMRSKSALVRQEAVAAFARSKTSAGKATPTALLDLCNDTDMRVRVAALTALAVHRPPGAAEVLSRATHDYDLTVRAAAIAALGALGTAEARQTLDKLRSDPSEIARAAAIGALGAMGIDRALITAATDRSPRVRQAVAESLAQVKGNAQAIGREAEDLAKTLVQDASSEVQRQAIESLQTWPLDRAGPALLLAMEQGGFLTRQLAAEHLAERWPPATDFSANASTEHRREQLAALRDRWQQQFGTFDEQIVRAVATEAIDAIGLTDSQRVVLEQRLKQLADPALSSTMRTEALRALEQLGPDLVTALESRTADGLRTLPPEVYAVVLPEVSPLFKSLEQLTSPDERVRRAAASELAAQLHGQRLSEMALNRLVQHVENETDPLVWQAVMTSIADDPRTTATRLAYIAVGNASSEVRRRACTYMKDHPNRSHWDVLLPMVDDGNLTVAIAAVQAIGAAGVQDPQPLIRLLNVPERQLRLEAAVALAQSQFDSGLAAIERLSHEADLEVRRAATVAMGQIAEEVFVPRLMELLDDRRDIQIAAMASLTAIAGRDVAYQEGAALLPDEQVRRWKRWYASWREASKPSDESY